MTDWPKLVLDLKTEHGVSERRLAKVVGLNRNTLRRFFERKTCLDIECLERLLNLFGHDVDIVKIAEPSPDLQTPAPPPRAPKVKPPKSPRRRKRQLIGLTLKVADRPRPQRLIIIRKGKA